MLAPLNKLAYIKRKYEYTQVKQDAFGELKWIVARDNLSTYLEACSN